MMKNDDGDDDDDKKWLQLKNKNHNSESRETGEGEEVSGSSLHGVLTSLHLQLSSCLLVKW